MSTDSSLPCGCRHCGCVCSEHSPSGLDWHCSRHRSVLLAGLHEAATLGALGLFLASVFVWAAVLAG